MDGAILLWIQEYIRNPMLTPIMKVITALGDAGIFWILVAILCLCIKKTRKAGATIVLALLFSLIVNNGILKNAVARIRPYEVVDGLQCLVGRAVDFSFPSGHSGSSFAAATVIAYLFPKKYGVPAVILAALIAFSRLYVGIHYPTDVLVGILDGILLGGLAVWWNPFRAEKLSANHLNLYE
jgi:Membrane-associated phospholipid phosphatase